MTAFFYFYNSPLSQVFEKRDYQMGTYFIALPQKACFKVLPNFAESEPAFSRYTEKVEKND